MTPFIPLDFAANSLVFHKGGGVQDNAGSREESLKIGGMTSVSQGNGSPGTLTSRPLNRPGQLLSHIVVHLGEKNNTVGTERRPVQDKRNENNL